MAIRTRSTERSNAKLPGSMKSWWCANSPPATPPIAALSVNAVSLRRVVSRPAISAAVSSSRTARNSSHSRERSSSITMPRRPAVHSQIDASDTFCMPWNPPAPPVASRLRKKLRVISPKPSVAIAR